ncbi:hypothetical protein Taro_047567 [Colocasia esculenta]|uniref:Uncharacterized protein n=1 Tax=Colocasia esculenta TaxID=4460 RepID=A0A843WTA3_COLES|nr:hypothetical protein [Colocasia esculenta]
MYTIMTIVPALEERLEAPVVQIRSEALVQIPEQEDQFNNVSSLPVQDAPEDTISEVLRDLQGKGVASEDVPAFTPLE